MTINIIRDKWTRRNLLSRFGKAGAVSALAPFVPLMEAGAAEGKVQRFAWWYTGQYDATVAGYYHNNTTGAANFPDKSPFIPLNAWQEKIALVQGIDNKAAPQSGGGGPHRRGAITGMTGANLVKKGGKDPDLFKGSTLNGNGNSLDQIIARTLESRGVTTPYRSLHMGWHFNSPHLGERSFSYWNKAPQTIEQNPKVLFDKMFKLVKSQQGNGGGGSGMSSRASVLDYVRDSVKSLNNRISANDRIKLDAHLTSIEELEKTLESISNGGFACPEINELEKSGVVDRNGIPTGIVKAGMQLGAMTESFFDLMAIAFNCDLTRVATFQFSRGTDDHVYSFLNDDIRKYPGDFHGYTHNQFGTQSGELPRQKGVSGITDRMVTAVVKWRSEQFARFMGKLDAMDETGGTVLDNSAICWWSDVSQAHDYDKMRWVVAGSAGGRFKVGKRTHHGGTPTNGLLNTIARSFDIDQDIGTYGKGAVFNDLLA